MNVLELTIVLALVSCAAGFLGALTGLGGGVVLVPVLTIFFHVDLRYAIGASLVSVIATSSGAAAAYVKEGFTNIRIGMFLEIATCIGAIVGAYLGTMVHPAFIAAVFGIVLLYSAWLSLQKKEEHISNEPDEVASKLRLEGTFPEDGGEVHYAAKRTPLGFSLMGVAGILSGLLGIGSGAVKVIAMDQVMGLPFKVSTTTSNFMIGVTAAASACVYFHRGYVDPGLSMPVMLGVLAGSILGARLLMGAEVLWLRRVFAATIFLLAIEMLFKAGMGSI